MEYLEYFILFLYKWIYEYFTNGMFGIFRTILCELNIMRGVFMSTINFINSSKGLKQPSKENPFLPREWVHMFHEIEITRGSDGQSIIVPCTSANFF